MPTIKDLLKEGHKVKHFRNQCSHPSIYISVNEDGSFTTKFARGATAYDSGFSDINRSALLKSESLSWVDVTAEVEDRIKTSAEIQKGADELKEQKESEVPKEVKAAREQIVNLLNNSEFAVTLFYEFIKKIVKTTKAASDYLNEDATIEQCEAFKQYLLSNTPAKRESTQDGNLKIT